MRYRTKMTSKGTITISAPIRKALGFKPGQTIELELDAKNNRVLMDTGMTIERFEKIRDEVLSNYPNRPKGLSMNAMRNLAANEFVKRSK